MKLSKNLLILIIALFSFSLAGCKDDEDTNYAKDIEGTYKGDLNLGGQLPVGTNVEIKIERKDNSHVTLTLNENLTNLPPLFEGGGAIEQLPLDVSCVCIVTYSVDPSYLGTTGYYIGGETMVTLPIPGLSSPVETSVGGIITSEYDATINIVVDIMGTPLTVIFEGDKQ